MFGFHAKVDRSLIIRGSKKQNAVGLPTCEADYHATDLVAEEFKWMLCVLLEWKKSIHHPNAILSNNQSAIGWATGKQPQCYSAKHVDVQIHFVREVVNNGQISFQYVESKGNDAD